jgi:hypothetical protein
MISAFFLGLHLSYSPFKSPALNRLQSLALTTITLLYFIGVLLKTDTVEESDREDLGVLMIVIVVSVNAAVVAMLASEIRAVVQWAWPVWHAFGIRYEGCIRRERCIPCIGSFPGA